jgi:hypothetical protein
MKSAFTALALLLPGACVVGPTPDIVAPAGTAVSLGQRVEVGRYVVRPISIYQDSRCPAGVRCIWAGRLVLYVLVDGPDVHANVYLTLGMPAPVGHSTINLATVTPERFAEIAPRPETYRFTFSGGAERSSAATPGNSRPSIHSRKAPPAVET